MNLSISTIYGYKKYLLLSIISASVGFSALGQETSPNSAPVSPASAVQRTVLDFRPGEEVDISKGHWIGNLENGLHCIEFRGDGSETWNILECFEPGVFEKKSENIAMLNREAGTLIITGKLDPDGFGRYSFTSNDSFRRYLDKNKLSEGEDEFMLPLFLGDMKITFIDFLRDHYGNVEANQIKELALHDISLNDFKEYLFLYRNYGAGDPSLKQVITTKLNGIDKAYVEELHGKGYSNLRLTEMMKAKTMGVTAATIEGFAEAGFKDIPMERLLETRIHGLSPSTAVHLQRISTEALSLEAILQLQMRGVNEAFLKDLEMAGFAELNLEQVLQARLHGIGLALVTYLRTVGIEDPEFGKLLEAKVQGVDTSFVGALKNAELKPKNLQEIVTAKHYGVDFSEVEGWRAFGFEKLELEELIKAKIHDLQVEDARIFEDAGVKVYSIEELLSAKIHGVDMGYISKLEGLPKGTDPEEQTLTQEPVDNLEHELVEEPTEEELEEESTDEKSLIVKEQIQQEGTSLQEKGEHERELMELHEYISRKLQEDAAAIQKERGEKDRKEQEAAESDGRDMFEISLPETGEE